MSSLRKIDPPEENPSSQPATNQPAASAHPALPHKQDHTSQQEDTKHIAFSLQKTPDPSPLAEAFTPSVTVPTAENDKELFRVKSFWLLDLFPNELIIKEKSIHVIAREFLRSQVETMLIQDISIVTITQGILFSSLTISYRIPHDDFFINNIPKDVAVKAKAVLDSLILAKQAKPEKVEVLEDTNHGAVPVTPAIS